MGRRMDATSRSQHGCAPCLAPHRSIVLSFPTTFLIKLDNFHGSAQSGSNFANEPSSSFSSMSTRRFPMSRQAGRRTGSSGDTIWSSGDTIVTRLGVPGTGVPGTPYVTRAESVHARPAWSGRSFRTPPVFLALFPADRFRSRTPNRAGRNPASCRASRAGRIGAWRWP